MESNTVNPPPPRRACEECNRKKTKCDMKWPLCGLCQRTGQQCTFPTRRKQHVRRQRSVTRISKASGSATSNLERLVNLLTSRVETEGTRRQEATRLIEILSSSLPATSCHGQAASQTNPEHLVQVPIVSQSDHQSGEATSTVIDNQEDSRRTSNGGQDALDQQQSTPALEPGVHSSSSSSSSSYTPHHLPPYDAANEEIPANLARRLVDTFFARIQPWLPIFHKPRFYKKHLDPGTHQLRNMKELPADEALLFWAMLALSARHCQWDGVDDVSPPNRDVAFASHAIRLQEEAWKGAGNSPSIAHVQGCVLLAFYLYSCGSFCQGWVLVGICVRLVYELDIQNIDRDGGDTTLLLVDDWVSREEKRRLWWLIWELDRFGSSLAERPYAIDNRDTAVMLPVSDKNWFSEIPVASVKLDPRPEMAWKALQGCPNQDSRAWFLVGNYLLCLIDERKHYESIEDQRLQLDAVMNCFRLVLPREFHLDSGALVFGPDKFAQWNWVIGTQLMVLTARGKLDEMSSGDTNAQAQDKCPNQQSRSYLEELLRILSVWPPECIGYAHPFLACTILGPRSVNIARPIETEDALTTLKNELTRLALSQYATYWKLGSVLLDLCDFVQEARTMPSLNSPVKYLSALVPSSQQARNHYPSPNGQLPVDNFYFLQPSIHASDGSTSSYHLAPDQRARDAAQPPAALSTIYSSDNISALDTYSGLDTDLTDSFQDCFPDIFG